MAVFYQMTYSATLLSFMGAVHWGLAMANYSALGSRGEWRSTKAQDTSRYVLSTVPTLGAWAMMGMGHEAAMAGLALGFTGQLIADAAADKKGLVPSWYMRLRAPLTFVVLAGLGTSFILLGTSKQA